MGTTGNGKLALAPAETVEIEPVAPLPLAFSPATVSTNLASFDGWGAKFVTMVCGHLEQASRDLRDDICKLVQPLMMYWLEVAKKTSRHDADALLGLVALAILNGLEGDPRQRLTEVPGRLLVRDRSPEAVIGLVDRALQFSLAHPDRPVGPPTLEPALLRQPRRPIFEDRTSIPLTTVRQLAHRATQATGPDRVWFGTRAGQFSLKTLVGTGYRTTLWLRLSWRKRSQHLDCDVAMRELQHLVSSAIVAGMWAVELRPMPQELRETLRMKLGSALGQVLLNEEPEGVPGWHMIGEEPRSVQVLHRLLHSLGRLAFAPAEVAEDPASHPYAAILAAIESAVTGDMRWEMDPGVRIEVVPPAGAPEDAPRGYALLVAQLREPQHCGRVMRWIQARTCRKLGVPEGTPLAELRTQDGSTIRVPLAWLHRVGEPSFV